MNRRLQALYLMALARNITPVHCDRVVTQLGGVEALLDAADDELRSLELPGGSLKRLIEARHGADLEAELASLSEKGIAVVGWGDEGYPELLAQLKDAPLMLFCRGDATLMRHHGIAIVGSRKCSERGRELAQRFARELAELGVPVISGMALGIDGAAHEGALAVPGPTVAVLGCGVDVIYPPQHHELYERLCAQALVVSEYPLAVEPRKEHFPQRNRIISGLSRGALIVEAPMGSGALITARHATDQGREVFALPGPLGSPYTAGTHSLIKVGQAKLVEQVDDILVEFGTSRAALRGTRRTTASRSSSGQATTADATALAAKEDGPQASLTEDERRVLEALSYEGSHINDVVRKLRITTSDCIGHLTMLEIKGLISSASGGYYVRL